MPSTLEVLEFVLRSSGTRQRELDSRQHTSPHDRESLSADALLEAADACAELLAVRAAEAADCTCGSGGHPRDCAKHPFAREAHAAELSNGYLREEVEELEARVAELEAQIRKDFDEDVEGAAIEHETRKRTEAKLAVARRAIEAAMSLADEIPAFKPDSLGMPMVVTRKQEKAERLRAAVADFYALDPSCKGDEK